MPQQLESRGGGGGGRPRQMMMMVVLIITTKRRNNTSVTIANEPPLLAGTRTRRSATRATTERDEFGLRTICKLTRARYVRRPVRSSGTGTSSRARKPGACVTRAIVGRELRRSTCGAPSVEARTRAGTGRYRRLKASLNLEIGCVTSVTEENSYL